MSWHRTAVLRPYGDEGGEFISDASWHAVGKRSVAGRKRHGQRRTRLGARGAGIFGQGQLLLFVLELVEAVIDAALGEKLLMRALLAETAFVEDEDAVGVLNGAEAMRDDEGGAAAEQAVEGIANQQLGFRVHAGSGLVEGEGVRILRQWKGAID